MDKFFKHHFEIYGLKLNMENKQSGREQTADLELNHPPPSLCNSCILYSSFEIIFMQTQMGDVGFRAMRLFLVIDCK